MSPSRPKRTSMEYYFQPQMKKILNDESEEYKISIYKKTMQKLKDGAKLNTSPRSTVDVVTTPTKSSTLHSELKRGLKQISLNRECALEIDTKVTNPREFCSTLPLPPTCSFCERLGCFATLNKCTKCTEYFCDKCSFSTFTALEGSHVCKSCFP